MTHEIYYEEIVVCLFDGKYNLGVAALVNSLAKAKFKGLINVGYRGKLPGWVNQLIVKGDSYFYLAEDKEIVIHFQQLFTDMHLGYFKPFFIKETFDTYAATQKIYYFDADIIVNSPWAFFSNWFKKGACLCLDNAFHFLHHSHPWRKDWIQLASADLTRINNINYYFNSGFVGIERSSIALIHRWIYFSEKYIGMGGDIYAFNKDVFSSFKGDQDLLNAAITLSPDIEISVIGTEGMGFTLPATLMMHAIGDNKPWDTNFIKQIIKSGRSPGMSEQTFFSHCKFPINIFTPFNFSIKKLDLLCASFLGRFIG